MRMFASNGVAVTSAVVLALIVAAAVAAPRIVPFRPDQQDLDRRLAPPDATHFLGTDGYGRDVLSRIIVGARASLVTGVTATALAMVIGTTIGALSGYFRGPADLWLTRLTELVFGIPRSPSAPIPGRSCRSTSSPTYCRR